ncbi:DNA sulfur modification protein DndB [Vibrio chagasii]|uniref:DNA sulfur modification protein DndB n=1 Tax=Vibrio chagasii TaxID=170679 RepID=UPI003DA136DC
MTEFDDDLYEEKNDQCYTPTKAVLKGDFSVSNYTVPYYQANLTLEEIHRHLKLVEDMPSEHRHKWSLEELFQRDINWPRVEEDIVVNYLKRKEKRSFFNSLTVALLPMNNDGKLGRAYNKLELSPPSEPPFNIDKYEVTQVGGVQIASNGSSSNIQYLRWDEKNIFAATIDGQHRLAALKKFFETSNLSLKQRNTRVPVIFLVLDSRVGFDMPSIVGNNDDNPLLSVVREVFVDLNKHAKLISNARQILLDDQDLESICTRNLLVGKTREELPDKLPLGLVNWKDDSVKFDSGSYFTSVSVLHMVIKDILSIKYPEDPLDEDHVRSFSKSVEDSLFISDIIYKGEGENSSIYKGKRKLEEYCLDKVTLDEEPIKILPYEYSLAAVDSFNLHYKPFIYGIFSRFKPYKDFWELTKEVGGVDGELAFYNSLSLSAQKNQKNNIWSEEEFEEYVRQPENELSVFKKDQWAFMVVWQKALLKATKYAYFQYSSLERDNIDSEGFLDHWISFLNELYEKGIFNISHILAPKTAYSSERAEGHLWEGISKNPVTLTIKYSNTAVNRIQDTLILFWYYKKSNATSPSEFIEIISDKNSLKKYPGASKLLNSVAKALVPVAKHRFSLTNEEEIKVNCRERLKLILSQLDYT